MIPQAPRCGDPVASWVASPPCCDAISWLAAIPWAATAPWLRRPQGIPLAAAAPWLRLCGGLRGRGGLGLRRRPHGLTRSWGPPHPELSGSRPGSRTRGCEDVLVPRAPGGGSARWGLGVHEQGCACTANEPATRQLDSLLLGEICKTHAEHQSGRTPPPSDSRRHLPCLFLRSGIGPHRSHFGPCLTHARQYWLMCGMATMQPTVTNIGRRWADSAKCHAKHKKGLWFVHNQQHSPAQVILRTRRPTQFATDFAYFAAHPKS